MRSIDQLLTASAASVAIMAGGGQPAAAHNYCDPFQTVMDSFATDTSFNSLVLDPHNKGAAVEVTEPGTKIMMVNPLVAECGKHIVGYIARETKVETIEVSANKVRITEYIGHKAIGIKDPQKAGFVVSRTLRATHNSGTTPPGFTDGKNSYGFMP